MPLDYSKWDALELSDDSDIEVHPNVDKRSFIRAKQNQIHQERYQRKHQIETLKYEKIINDGFLRRIDGLLTALQTHKADAESRSPDELIFTSIMESRGDPKDDQPPPRPEGVHTEQSELPTYSKMMATLVDQVRATVDEKKPDNRFEAYTAEVYTHKAKIEDLQKQLLEKLGDLQREESRKITSESIHTGFNSSSVTKAESAKPPEKPAVSKGKGKEEVQAVEVLNPHVLSAKNNKLQPESSGAEADVDEPAGSDDDEVEPTELGKAFARIKPTDYRACLQFISQNPSVLAERETDGLLVLAFNSELAGKGDFARQCVQQALLLQYCRSLGRDGVGLFFKRITTPGHQAQKVFGDDVRDTYNRIRTRAKEIKLEREREAADGSGGVEQIQLHAVDPGTTINITIPPENSQDPSEQQARRLFEAFSPGLRRALESASLDEVNKVLGKMSVEEAEEVVGQLSEGGMLSLEEQIIDATTEEGQEALKQFEEQERATAAERRAAEPAGDPE
ncbi:MAG: hsp90 co-chaperone Cdc37 [Claussenomyces sp. TS43310]|nr:MAG: hsp90 co-chaperone Cdc37 [Claussenomyces sp. TS43310]